MIVNFIGRETVPNLEVFIVWMSGDRELKENTMKRFLTKITCQVFKPSRATRLLNHSGHSCQSAKYDIALTL